MNDLLLLLGVAFALDLLIGDPHSPLHPVALFGNYAAKVEAFARRRFGSTVRAGSSAGAWPRCPRRCSPREASCWSGADSVLTPPLSPPESGSI